MSCSSAHDDDSSDVAGSFTNSGSLCCLNTTPSRPDQTLIDQIFKDGSLQNKKKAFFLDVFVASVTIDASPTIMQIVLILSVCKNATQTKSTTGMTL